MAMAPPSSTGTPLIATLILLFFRALPSLSEHQLKGQSCDSDSNNDLSSCTWSSSSSLQEEPNENQYAVDEIIELPHDFIDPCQDEDPRCYEWAVEGECRRNLHYMLSSCARSCGSCQSLPGGDRGLSAEERIDEIICLDKHAGGECHKWAMEGECLINPTFMHSHCKYSCWECVDDQRYELLVGIPNGEIQRKAMYATMDRGKQQLIREISEQSNNPMTSDDREKVISRIRQMDHYAKYIMTDASVDTKARQRCRNEFRMCAEWASRGLCHSYSRVLSQQFPSYYENDLFYNHEADGTTKNDILFMMNMCPLACSTCHLLKSFHKCVGRRHPHAQPSFQSGSELRSFFDKFSRVDDDDDDIRQQDWRKFEPILASYPIHAKEGIEVVDSSYVVIFRNFLSLAEAEQLTSVTESLTWSDATNTNINNAEYASCHDDARCENDDIYQRIMNRIGALSESISISHLEPMSFIRLHSTNAKQPLQHNFEIGSSWKPAGPRILSLSFVISVGTDNDDDGGEGGGIGFPHLDWLHVLPRKGMAVLWPNVRDDDLLEPDWSTSFEYMPLLNRGGGEVSVVMSTVHVRLHNYTDANVRGCA